MKEARFTRVLNKFPALLLVVDAETLLVLCTTPGVANAFGYAGEDVLLGRPFGELFHDANAFNELITECKSRSHVSERQEQALDAKGNPLLVTVSMQAGDYFGNDAIFVSIADLSEMKSVEKNLYSAIIALEVEIKARQEVELALKKSEEQYRILTDAAQVGIWQLSTDGLIVFVNPKMCEILEISSIDEIKGRDCFSFFRRGEMKLLKAEPHLQSDGFITIYEDEIYCIRLKY